MTKKSHIALCLLLLTFGCREPFEGFDFQRNVAKLVIEAILTDTGDLGYVRISHTEPVNGDAIRDFVSEDNASVTVEDDQGTEYVFYSQGEGLYANGTFSAEYGRSYRLTIQVGENSYQSDWQSLAVSTPTPLQVSYSPDTVQVLNDLGRPVIEYAVTLHDRLIKGTADHYYYWRFNYFYIYDAYGQPDVLPLLPQAKRFCYVQEHDRPQLVVLEDRHIEGLNDTEYGVEITSVPFGRKMIYDYSVQVIRYNIPESHFRYFSRIEDQLKNTGGVFDTAPSTIIGNLTKTRGDLEVLGYFGVFNAVSQRLFFNQTELPFRKLTLPTDAVSCPGHHVVELSNTCFNCTAVAAPFNSTEKPAWWR